MRDKKVRNIFMIVFAVAIVVVSVAYAALITNLNIQGIATISGNWEISFQEPSSSEVPGPNPSTVGSAQIIEAILSDTIAKLQVEVSKPKDAVTYTFQVVNQGTIDAQVSSIVLPDMEALASYHIFYELSYETLSNGIVKIDSDMTESEITAATSKIQNDVLAAGTLVDGQVQVSDGGTRTLTIYVQFKDISNDEFNQNPNSTVLNLDTTILYAQAKND